MPEAAAYYFSFHVFEFISANVLFPARKHICSQRVAIILQVICEAFSESKKEDNINRELNLLSLNEIIQREQKSDKLWEILFETAKVTAWVKASEKEKIKVQEVMTLYLNIIFNLLDKILSLYLTKYL